MVFPATRIPALYMTPITGSIVALVTPMHEDGSVDYPTCAS
jgi:4-hydroxy-tetrahydrodipicolinate synthase